jgi:NADH:ubiquinone oxidoreductase subunit 2 (subunit N)
LAGFFSKIFIFISLGDSHFSILFVLFFVLTFLGLYFYMQNIRFLNTSSRLNKGLIFEKNVRTVLSFYYLALPNALLLLLGFLVLDDLFIFIK